MVDDGDQHLVAGDHGRGRHRVEQEGDLADRPAGGQVVQRYPAAQVVVALSPDGDFGTGGSDAPHLTDAATLRVPVDPFLSPADIASDADLDRLSDPAPADLLARAMGLPVLEVVVPTRPMTVAGVEGRAVDVRVRDLPPEAQRCGQGSGVGLPVCAVLVLPRGSAPLVQPGQELRFVELEVPAGRVFVYQNPGLPEAPAVVDGLSLDLPAG